MQGEGEKGDKLRVKVAGTHGESYISGSRGTRASHSTRIINRQSRFQKRIHGGRNGEGEVGGENKKEVGVGEHLRPYLYQWAINSTAGFYYNTEASEKRSSQVGVVEQVTENQGPPR